MRMGFRAAAGACLVLLSPLTAMAQESTDRDAQARALLQSGEAPQAYALLAPQAAQRAGDPHFDLLLGIAAVDSGRFPEAIIALQRVLAVDPDNVRAKAELGRAYAYAGDIDTARSELRTVLGDPTVPDPVRRRIDGLVRNMDKQAGEGGAAVTGYFDAEVGYDSNINTATDLTSITLPIFAFLGPATLNPAAREQADGFYQLQGGVSLNNPLSRQTRIFVSALGNWRDNFDHQFTDQAAIVGSAGLVHTMANGDAVSLTAQAQRFWLNRNGFRTSAGVVGQYTVKLDSNRALGLSAQYHRLDYDGQPLMDADRYAASITYADSNLFAALGGGVETTVRPGADHLGYAFANLQLGGELPLGEGLALLGGAAVEYRDHEGRDPLFLAARHDWRFDASVGVRYALGNGLSVRPRVTYTRNDSNIALYDYDRLTASIGLRFDF